MEINQPAHTWQLRFEGAWTTSVAFLDGGQHVAAGNRLGQIFVWRLPDSAPPSEEKSDSPPDLQPVLRLDGHTNGITRMAATPNGKTLISASLDSTICLWDIQAKPAGDEEIILDAEARKQQARGKKKEDADKIINAPPSKVSVVKPQHTLTGHKSWVKALGVSKDGKRIISGDDSCQTIVWDLVERKQIASWDGYERVWVSAAALTSAGKRAFTSEYAGSRSSFDRPAAQARLWNADNGEMQVDLLKIWTPDVKDADRVDSYGYAQAWGKLFKRGLVCAAFSGDDKLLAVGQGGETDTGKVHLVDVESGKILRTVSGHRYGACDVKFSADDKYVISSGRDTTVRICQVSDGKEVAALGKSRGGQFKDWIHGISISPDQKWIAGADIAGLVQIWRLA